MYKILKFKWEDREKHYWGSDFHNYHNPSWPIPIWKQRGYNSFEESFEDVRTKLNSKLKPDDYLWCLGDSFLSANDNDVIEWWNSINCNNIMMLFGNHESQIYRLYKKQMMVDYNRDDIEVYPLRMGNLVFCGNHLEIQIGKKRIINNHFPLRTHNQVSHSSWHLHGHSHNNDHTRNPDYPIGKTCDVSWDWKKDIWSFNEFRVIVRFNFFFKFPRSYFICKVKNII